MKEATQTRPLHSTRRFMAYWGLALLAALSCISIIVVAISLIGYHFETETVATKIKTALSTGTAAFPSSWDRNMQTGIDTYTDCQLLEVATFGHHSITDALTNAYYPHLGEGAHPCDHLSENIGPKSPEQPYGNNWRYWCGSASLINIALHIDGMSLPLYQSALKFSFYALVMLIGITAFFRYRRAALPLLPVLIALVFGFAIPLFGQSVGQAPSLIVGLVLLLIYMMAGIDRAAPIWQYFYLFNAGGLICYFELMQGYLIAILMLFALVRIVSIRALGAPNIRLPSRIEKWPTTAAVASLMAAYSMGVASVVLLRIFIRAAVLNRNLLTVMGEWLKELTKRTHHSWDELGPANANLSFALHRMYYNLEVATFPYLGRHATLFVYALCGFLYLMVFARLAYNLRNLTAARKDIVLAVCTTAAIVPLWYCIFLNHTVVHFFITGRLLSLFFAFALSLAILALDKDRMSTRTIGRHEHI